MDPARGWPRSLSGAVLGSATGVSALLLYTNGLFVAGLTADFGLTRSQFGLGVLLVTMALACANPMVGWLVDRMGAKWPAVGGLLLLSVVTLGLVFAGFVSGLNLAWTALAGGALLMVVARRDTHEVLKLVDWHLLVFFAALFVVVEGLNGTGLPDRMRTRKGRRMTWPPVMDNMPVAPR